MRDAGTGLVSTSTFSETHFPERDWALVWWDDVAMVFVRRGAAFADLVAEREFRAFRPEAWKLSGGLSPGEAVPGPLIDEIRRKIDEDPGCRLAREAASVYHLGGTPTER